MIILFNANSGPKDLKKKKPAEVTGTSTGFRVLLLQFIRYGLSPSEISIGRQTSPGQGAS